MKHIHGLNALRAFAVFFVLIAHLGFWFDDTSASGRFISRILIPGGGFAVRLFFVLSGFLITSLLLRAKREMSGQGRLVIIRNFFIRRSLRIFPIYYLVIFTLLVFHIADTRATFPYLVTYTTNILIWQRGYWGNMGHTWSLAVEEQFYLAWPWLIVFTGDRYLRYVIAGVVIAGVVSNYVTINTMARMPVLATDSLDSLGLGAAYAIAYVDGESVRRFERSVKNLIVPFLALYFYAEIASEYKWSLQVPYFLLKVNESVVALWLLVLICSARSVRWRKCLLDAPPLDYIGRISYGIYLYHGAYIAYCYNSVTSFFQWMAKQFPALRDVFLDRHSYYWLHIGIVILISALSFRFLETPLLGLKDRFR